MAWDRSAPWVRSDPWGEHQQTGWNDADPWVDADPWEEHGTDGGITIVGVAASASAQAVVGELVGLLGVAAQVSAVATPGVLFVIGVAASVQTSGVTGFVEGSLDTKPWVRAPDGDVGIVQVAPEGYPTSITLEPFTGERWLKVPAFTNPSIVVYGTAAQGSVSAEPGVPPKSTYQTAVLNDAPYLWWPMRDESGLVVEDWSGNGRHGTWNTETGVVRAIPSLLAGDWWTATDTNGSAAYAFWTLPGNGGDLTVEMWVRPDDVSQVEGLWSLNDYLELRIGDTSLRPGQLQIWANGGTTKVSPTDAALDLQDDEVVQLVLTYYAAGNAAILYLKGEPVFSATLVDATSQIEGNLRLPWDSGGEGKFSGAFQHLSIYRTVLTEDQVRAHYIAGSGTVLTQPGSVTVTAEPGVVDPTAAVDVMGEAAQVTATAQQNEFLILFEGVAAEASASAPLGTVMHHGVAALASAWALLGVVEVVSAVGVPASVVAFGRSNQVEQVGVPAVATVTAQVGVVMVEGATAVATATAEIGTVLVAGAVASVGAEAVPGEVVTIMGAVAEVSVTAGRGATAGEEPRTAIEITGDGTYTIDFTQFSISDDEPPLDTAIGSTGNQTIWFKHTPEGPGTLFFQVGSDADPYDVVLEVYDEDLTLIAAHDSRDALESHPPYDEEGNLVEEFLVSDGVPVYFRVYPFLPDQTWTSVPVEWDFTLRVAALNFQYNVKPLYNVGSPSDVDVPVTTYTIKDTPTTVKVDIGNAGPEELAGVYLDDEEDVPLAVVVLDDMGQAVAVTIAIPEIPQGTHTLTARAGLQWASIELVVLEDPLPYPVDWDPDTYEITPEPMKWRIYDPAPDGMSYIFEIGPSEMTSPYAPKALTADATTARDGQMLSWEGASPAVTWTLTGELLTQSQYEALRAFSRLNRRVWIVDHLGRGWVVTVERFSATPKRALDYPWRHSYTLDVLIYDGPREAT